MNVNFYYDWMNHLNEDPEGQLVQLCAECADLFEGDMDWAGEGDTECVCWRCGRANDPEGQAWLNESE